jgi:phosphoribosylanthranilate isomerase
LTLAQLQNYFILSEFQNKLDVFKKENSLRSVLMSTDEDVDNALKALQPEALQVLTKSYGTSDQIKQKLKYDIDMKLLQQSEEFKKLSTEKQQEFNKIMVDYYVYNESIGLGIELRQIW